MAEASFGIGILCWLLFGSLLLNRLFFRPMLPPPLVPTLAIEFAPPVVAGVAYFTLTGGAVNFIAAALGGYAVVMAIVQLRSLPAPWSPSSAGSSFRPWISDHNISPRG